MSLYAIEFKSTAEKASLLLSKVRGDVALPNIPLSAINDFIDGKRPEIYKIVLDGEVMITVEASVESAMALRDLMAFSKTDTFPLNDIPSKNLKAFVAGKRDNVALLEIVKHG